MHDACRPSRVCVCECCVVCIARAPAGCWTGIQLYGIARTHARMHPRTGRKDGRTASLVVCKKKCQRCVCWLALLVEGMVAMIVICEVRSATGSIVHWIYWMEQGVGIALWIWKKEQRHAPQKSALRLPIVCCFGWSLRWFSTSHSLSPDAQTTSEAVGTAASDWYMKDLEEVFWRLFAMDPMHAPTTQRDCQRPRRSGSTSTKQHAPWWWWLLSMRSRRWLVLCILLVGCGLVVPATATPDPAIGFVSRVVSMESVSGQVKDSSFVLSAFDWSTWRRQWHQWISSHWSCSSWGKWSSSSSSINCGEDSQAVVRLKFRIKSSMTLTHLAHYSLDFVNAMSQFPWRSGGTTATASNTTKPVRCDYIESSALDATHLSLMSISLAIPVLTPDPMERQSIISQATTNASTGTSNLLQFFKSHPELAGSVPFLQSMELVDVSAFGELFVPIDFHASALVHLVLQQPISTNGGDPPVDLGLLMLDCIWNLQLRMRVAKYFQPIGLDANDILIRFVRQMPLQVYYVNAKVVAMQIHVRDPTQLSFVQQKLWDREFELFLRQQVDPPLQLLVLDVDDASFACHAAHQPSSGVPMQPIAGALSSVSLTLFVQGFSWQQLEAKQSRILDAIRMECGLDTSYDLAFGHANVLVDRAPLLSYEFWALAPSDRPINVELRIRIAQSNQNLAPQDIFTYQLETHNAANALASVLGLVDAAQVTTTTTTPGSQSTVRLGPLQVWPMTTTTTSFFPEPNDISAWGFVEAKLKVQSEWIAQQVDFFVQQRLQLVLSRTIFSSLWLASNQAVQIVSISDLPNDGNAQGMLNVVLNPFGGTTMSSSSPLPQLLLHVRVFIKQEIQRFMVQKLLLLPMSQQLLAKVFPNGHVWQVRLDLNADGLFPPSRARFINFPGVFGPTAPWDQLEQEEPFDAVGQLVNSKSMVRYPISSFSWAMAQSVTTTSRNDLPPTSCSNFVPATSQQFCVALHLTFRDDQVPSVTGIERMLLFRMVSSRQSLDLFQGGQVPVLRRGDTNHWVVHATVSDSSPVESNKLVLTFSMGFVDGEQIPSDGSGSGGASASASAGYNNYISRQSFVQIRINDTSILKSLPSVRIPPPIFPDASSPSDQQLLASLVQVATKSTSALLPNDRLFVHVQQVETVANSYSIELTLELNAHRFLGLFNVDSYYYGDCINCASALQLCGKSLECLRLQSCLSQELDQDGMAFVRYLSQSALAEELAAHQRGDPPPPGGANFYATSEVHVKKWSTASTFWTKCLYATPELVSHQARQRFVDALRCVLAHPCSVPGYMVTGSRNWDLLLKYTPKAHVLRFPPAPDFVCDLKVMVVLDPTSGTAATTAFVASLSKTTNANTLATDLTVFMGSQGMPEARVEVDIAVDDNMVTIRYFFARVVPFVQTLNGAVAIISTFQDESLAWHVVPNGW